MKKTNLLFGFLLLAQISFAQIGVTNGFQNLYAPNWTQAVQNGYNLGNVSIFQPNIYTSIDLAFLSKEKGYQFVPELNFSRQEIAIPFEIDGDLFGSPGFSSATDTYRATLVGLMLNNDFFIFRYNTPFRETPKMGEGNWFKEGFFLRLGFGITHMIQNRLLDSPAIGFRFGNFIGSTGNTLSGSFRLGAGLKLNLSDFFTVSPLVSATYSAKTSWNNLGDPSTISIDPTFGTFSFSGNINYDSPTSDYLQFFAGIRFEVKLKNLSKVKVIGKLE